MKAFRKEKKRLRLFGVKFMRSQKYILGCPGRRHLYSLAAGATSLIVLCPMCPSVQHVRQCVPHSTSVCRLLDLAHLDGKLKKQTLFTGPW